MLRSLTPILFAAALAHATLLPDQIGPAKVGQGHALSIPASDLALLNEYGFEAAEQAAYTAPGNHFLATAWRFRDSTGAMAFFELRRPAGATPSKLSDLAVTTSDGAIFAYGNYVFQLAGGLPDADDLGDLYAQLPKFERSALPTLMSDLPLSGLVPNSGRYIVGPVSLERFLPAVSPSAAAFHMGTEAQLGQYATPKGSMTMAIFSFPTPAIARERYDEFQKIPGAVAKRAGPLVAVTIRPPDADAAERVLAMVKYETNITWNEQLGGPTVQDSAKMIMAIVALAGLVLGLCLIFGIGFGAFRVVGQKLGWKAFQPGDMIVLHLGPQRPAQGLDARKLH